MLTVKVEFECVVCGQTAAARVTESTVDSGNRPLQTLRECPDCEMETIWIES